MEISSTLCNSQLVRARDVKFLYNISRAMYHTSHFMCRMAQVTCPVLHVTCHYKKNGQISGAGWCWVYYQRGLARLVKKQCKVYNGN